MARKDRAARDYANLRHKLLLELLSQAKAEARESGRKWPLLTDDDLRDCESDADKLAAALWPFYKDRTDKPLWLDRQIRLWKAYRPTPPGEPEHPPLIAKLIIE